MLERTKWIVPIVKAEPPGSPDETESIDRRDKFIREQMWNLTEHVRFLVDGDQRLGHDVVSKSMKAVGSDRYLELDEVRNFMQKLDDGWQSNSQGIWTIERVLR